MANVFSNLTGIHGRRIAMSATGAIVDKNGYGAVMADSSGVLQTIVKSYSELISSSAATLTAYGISFLSSGTATERNFTISAPSSGQSKEIFSFSSATTITIETTGSTITFVTTGTSSSAITFSGASGQFGQTISLKGYSSTRWTVLAKTSQVS